MGGRQCICAMVWDGERPGWQRVVCGGDEVDRIWGCRSGVRILGLRSDVPALVGSPGWSGGQGRAAGWGGEGGRVATCMGLAGRAEAERVARWRGCGPRHATPGCVS